MGLPSGVFSSASSGRLQIGFSGVWTQNSGADWGPGTGLQLNLRCVATNGADRRTAVLGFQTTTATMDFDYVAGTDVSVAMEFINREFDGPSTVRAHKLLIRCYLIKR